MYTKVGATCKHFAACERALHAASCRCAADEHEQQAGPLVCCSASLVCCSTARRMASSFAAVSHHSQTPWSSGRASHALPLTPGWTPGERWLGARALARRAWGRGPGGGLLVCCNCCLPRAPHSSCAPRRRGEAPTNRSRCLLHRPTPAPVLLRSPAPLLPLKVRRAAPQPPTPSRTLTPRTLPANTFGPQGRGRHIPPCLPGLRVRCRGQQCDVLLQRSEWDPRLRQRLAAAREAARGGGWVGRLLLFLACHWVSLTRSRPCKCAAPAAACPCLTPPATAQAPSP